MLQEQSDDLFFLEQSILIGIDFCLEKNILFSECLVLCFEVFESLFEMFDLFVIGLMKHIKLIIDFCSCEIDFFKFVFI